MDETEKRTIFDKWVVVLASGMEVQIHSLPSCCCTPVGLCGWMPPTPPSKADSQTRSERNLKSAMQPLRQSEKQKAQTQASALHIIPTNSKLNPKALPATMYNWLYCSGSEQPGDGGCSEGNRQCFTTRVHFLDKHK